MHYSMIGLFTCKVLGRTKGICSFIFLAIICSILLPILFLFFSFVALIVVPIMLLADFVNKKYINDCFVLIIVRIG